MPLTYYVAPTGDNLFTVVCKQDQTVHSVHDDEDMADFVAGEAYCDDEVMIAHEARL